MITGYNNRGEIKHQFDSMHQMASFLDIEILSIIDSFKKNRIYDWNNCKFYLEDKFGNRHTDPHMDDPEFVSDFGYPQPKSQGDDIQLVFDFEQKKYFEARNQKIVEMTEKSKDALGGKDGGSYSANGSSAHYKKAILEYVDKQERCYGTFLAYGLCFMQVDKYRDRAGKKDGVPADKDLVKAGWYDSATQFLREKIDLHNNDNKTLDDDRAFEEKYGLGRSIYIDMPAQLAILLEGEMQIEYTFRLKGLGEIVDNLQKK